jgi:hypothetical protein
MFALGVLIGLGGVDAVWAQSGDLSLDAAKRVFGGKSFETATPHPSPSVSTGQKDQTVVSPAPIRTPAASPASAPPASGLGARVDEVLRNPEDLDDDAKALLVQQALQKIEQIAQAGLKGYDRQEILKRLQADQADVDKNVRGATSDTGQSPK